MKTRLKYLFFLGFGYLVLWLSCFLCYSIINKSDIPFSSNVYLLIFLFLVIGICLMAIYDVFVLQPYRELKKTINEVISGNFSIRAKEVGTTETQEIIRNFNSMVEQIEKNEEIRNKFIETYSHEIKNPINTILGYADLSSNKEINVENKEKYIEIIKNESQYLSKVCDNNLLMFRLDARRILTNKTEFNLSQLIREIIANYIVCKKDDIELEIDICNSNHTIIAEKELIKEMIYNIVDNEYKYSQNKSKLKIIITNENNKTKLLFKSKPKEKVEIDKIREASQKCDYYYSTNGNGIGLSIINKIVELHSGDISYDYDGVNFYISIIFN